MGYKLLYDKQILFDVYSGDYVTDAQLSMSVNAISYFDFTISLTHSLYDIIAEHAGIVELYFDDAKLFSGEITKISVDLNGNKDITCAGALDYLSYTLVRPYSTIDGEADLLAPSSVDGYFNWLIEQHNKHCLDSRKHFFVGVNQGNLLDNNNYIYRASSTLPTTSSEIEDKILNSIGGYLYVRYKDDKNILDLYADTHEANTQIIDFGVNITDFVKTTSTDDQYTAVIATGYTPDPPEDDPQKKMNPITLEGCVDGGTPYSPSIVKMGDVVYDVNAVARYGYKEYHVSNEDIKTYDGLLQYACKVLNKLLSPSLSVSVKAVDLSLYMKDKYEHMQVGQAVRVRSKLHNIDEYLVVNSITLDMNNPENTEYQLGESYDTLTGQQSSYLRSLNSSIVSNLDSVAKLDSETKKNAKDIADTKVVASNAANKADKASEDATNAVSKSSEAIKNANEAKDTANGAVTEAGKATEAANSANTKADQATDLANSAKQEASTASNIASEAKKVADKAQADTNTNTKAVAQAQSTADAAKKAAADAQEKAENVESNLESANAVIEQHSNKLGELNTKVSNAVTNANSALTASTEAKQTATEASTTANTAYKDSQTAITNSTKATQTATEAKTTAESAVSTANDSLRQSSSAVQTANRIENTLTTEYQTKADSDALYATKSSLTETSESIKMEVSATYATKSTVEALQNVADNAIESWRGSGVPTSENKPASDWTTIEEKKRHSGDLYYDKDTGKAYRWGSDDGVIYSWVLNQDTDITKALQDASNAQKSANAAQSTANGAVTAAGNAQKSAEGAQSTADSAKTAAANAQKAADTAQLDVDQLKIDIPGTYATKASLETTAESITAQVESVSTTANSAVTAASKAQQTADAINVNLTKNYQTKENADNSYATKASLSATSESLSASITKAQQTADGAVNAASNAQQTADAININLTKNYQTTKDADDKYATQSNLNATADSITASVSNTYSTKTELTSAIDGISVGGRNLARKTSNDWSEWITPKANATNVVKESGSVIYFPSEINVGDEYYIQCEIEFDNVTPSDGKISYFRLQGSVDEKWEAEKFNPWAYSIKNIENGIVKISKKVTSKVKPTPPEVYAYCDFRVDDWATGRYRWRRIKVELGNKPTDWSPAPEDFQVDAANKADAALSESKKYTDAQMEITSDSITSTVSQTYAKKQYPDTRNDNNTPDWYFANYPRQSITEFKYCSVIGLSGDTYCSLLTEVPWTDASGGYPKQTASVLNKRYWRVGTNGSTWGAWKDAEGLADAASANATTALAAANNAATIANSKGIDYSQGKMLFIDPTFSSGLNSIRVYNNLGNGNVVIDRTEKSSDNPFTDASHELIIINSGNANPGLGGFTWSNASRPNAIFIYRIIAKIPVGYHIEFKGNAFGVGRSSIWLTDVMGNNRFKEYVCKVNCGSSGDFYSIGYFYIDGGHVGSASSPLKWYIAYATCFDMTNAGDIRVAQAGLESLTTRVNSAETKIEQNSDAIALRATKTEVTSAIDGISVGGRNLLLGTATFDITDISNLNKGLDNSDSFRGNSILKYNTAWHKYHVILLKFIQKYNLKGGELVTYSIWFKFTTDNLKDNDKKTLHINGYNGMSESENYNTLLDTLNVIDDANVWKRYSITFKVPENINEANNRVRIECDYFTESDYTSPRLTQWWSSPKLEFANKPTDWSPAPEDLVAESKTYTDAQIKVSADSINSTVSSVKTTADNALSNANNALDQINEIPGTYATKTEVNQTATDLTTTITTAQNTANDAKGAAESAQTTANEAKGTADSAKTSTNVLETLIRQSGDGVEVAKKVNDEYTSTKTLMGPDGFYIKDSTDEMLTQVKSNSIVIGKETKSHIHINPDDVTILDSNEKELAKFYGNGLSINSDALDIYSGQLDVPSGEAIPITYMNAVGGFNFYSMLNDSIQTILPRNSNNKCMIAAVNDVHSNPSGYTVASSAINIKVIANAEGETTNADSTASISIDSHSTLLNSSSNVSTGSTIVLKASDINLQAQRDLIIKGYMLKDFVNNFGTSTTTDSQWPDRTWDWRWIKTYSGKCFAWGECGFNIGCTNAWGSGYYDHVCPVYPFKLSKWNVQASTSFIGGGIGLTGIYDDSATQCPIYIWSAVYQNTGTMFVKVFVEGILA